MRKLMFSCLALVLCALPVKSLASTKPQEFVLYLSAKGLDTNTGETPKQAVQTLARAQQILRSKKVKSNVTILIAPGTYYGQRTSWTFYNPEFRTVITAQDPAKRPVFDGCTDANGKCDSGTWLILKAANGEPTNLKIRNIHVRNYTTAISFNGNRDDLSKFNSHNEVSGSLFERIGNVFNTKLPNSTAAIRMVNSQRNVVKNNHFKNVVNVGGGGGLIHPLYIAHHSSYNRIAKNFFEISSGDPVRLRDGSNFNVTRENRFVRAGNHAPWSEWYCDDITRKDCTKPTPECPSWGNSFGRNEVDIGYNGKTLPFFAFFQTEKKPNCSPRPADLQRLRTSGNKRISAQADAPHSPPTLHPGPIEIYTR